MVESCFGGAGQPLSIPGRVLVGEGVLTKMCRKRPKPRQFFLFNDILVYGNIIIGKKKYNKQHIIPLEDVKLQPLDDNGRKYICAEEKSVEFNIQLSFLFCFTSRNSKRMVNQNNNKILCSLCCNEYRKARMDGTH